MNKPKQEEDIRKATEGIQTAPRTSHPLDRGLLSKESIGEGLGWVLYLIVAHQFLHTCIFATNSTFLLPSFLAFLFPYHIDPILAGYHDYSGRINVRVEDLKDDLKRTTEAATHQISYSLDALGIDLLLLTAVAVHHSLMARVPWQRAVTSLFSRWGERLSYVLGSVFFFQLLFRHWVPLPTIVWQINNSLGASLMKLSCAFGFVWLLASLVTAARDDMFGFREAFSGKKTKADAPLRVHSVYKLSRMPVFFGVLLCLWSASTMTMGRLIFAIFFTIYTFVGGYFQDKDLQQKYGRQYESYKKRVPFLVPFVSY